MVLHGIHPREDAGGSPPYPQGFRRPPSQATELGAGMRAVMRQVMWAANVDVARIGVEGFETEPSQSGDVVYTPAGHWHGFNNTSDDDVLLIWGWEGAGSLEAAGYELPEDG